MKRKVTDASKYLKFLSSRKVIEKRASMLNDTLEVLKVGDAILLNSANTNYSFGGLHRVFRRAFEKINIAERDISNVLILGFGAGSVASILLEEYKISCKIKGVEKDPEVIRLGREYFNTRRYAGLEIVEADAEEFIRNENLSYDLIIVDLYVDFEVPAFCHSLEFIAALQSCLAENGMIMFNKMLYNHKARQEAHELEKIFNSLEGRVKVLKIRENVMNKVIVFEN
ncbi:MAG: methyltransferase domain-containing protein [Bacteroidetes bacterium]|nr:methyltransferase domain-containing protein [Bacteroidota bacterium]